MAPRLDDAAVARIEYSLTVEREYGTKPTHECMRQLASNHHCSHVTIYHHYNRLERGLQAGGHKGGQRRVITFEVEVAIR